MSDSDNLPQERTPWERLSDETDKAWDAFQYYCFDLSPQQRSYEKVADYCDHSSNRYIAKWADRYDWQDRIREYDAHVAQQRIREREREHKKRIQRLAKQQEQLSEAALDNAALALKQSRELLQKIDSDDSDMPNFQVSQIPSLLRAASKVAEVAGEMRARALGVDKILAHLNQQEQNLG